MNAIERSVSYVQTCLKESGAFHRTGMAGFYLSQRKDKQCTFLNDHLMIENETFARSMCTNRPYDEGTTDTKCCQLD